MVITNNRSIRIGNQVGPFTPRKKERRRRKEKEEEEEEINQRGLFAFKKTTQYKYR